MTTDDPGLVAIDTVLQAEVRHSNGEVAGQITSLLMDAATGQVEYIVLQTPGDATNQAILLPWSTATRKSDQEYWVVEIQPDRLRQAPRFELTERKSWPGQWRDELSKYYGAKPTWEKPANYTG